MNTANENDTHAFSSGAKSSGKMPRFDLIPWDIFASRLAARYELGSLKYGEGNWEKGLADREFVLDRANHMLNHAHRVVEQIRVGRVNMTDDDLAAVIWGAICLMAAQRIMWLGPSAATGPTPGDSPSLNGVEPVGGTQSPQSSSAPVVRL